jgi:hypothetical protein
MKQQLVPFLLTCAFGMVGGAAWADDNCEPLRSRIEANIASKGVTGFTVTTVDAGADTPGEVVGTCGLGSRKVVYQRSMSEEVVAADAPEGRVSVQFDPRPQRATPDSEIWVECADGSMVQGGRCGR